MGPGGAIRGLLRVSVALTENPCGSFPGAVELPSYLIGCFAMDRIGRKKTCAPALLLAGVACMLIIVVPAVRTTYFISRKKLILPLCNISTFVTRFDESAAVHFHCGYKTS